jgi:hypothetical protein
MSIYEYRDGVKMASDELVEFWNSRDLCWACDQIHTPQHTTDGFHHYRCPRNSTHPFDELTWKRPVTA